MSRRRSPGRGGAREQQVAAQDPEAERFRQLYEAHYSAILGYVLRRALNREEAADVVAETFLVAWRNLERVPRDETARLWLYATARRVLANQRRGERRRERLHERIAFEIDPIPREQPEGDLATVALAFGRLTAEDRELLGLVGWEGLRPAEIAAILGCSVGAVRLRIFRARRRLAHELAELGYLDERPAGDEENAP